MALLGADVDGRPDEGAVVEAVVAVQAGLQRLRRPPPVVASDGVQQVDRRQQRVLQTPAAAGTAVQHFSHRHAGERCGVWEHSRCR